MITGNYNLVVDPDWKNVQQQDVFLECDTTGGAVTINLFEIAELLRFWNVKIIISDVQNNASSNNIIVNAGGSDLFDNDTTNQLVLNSNGSSLSLQVVSESHWLAIESVGGVVAPIWDLIVGDTGLGADAQVESALTQVSETVQIQGVPNNAYKLRAKVTFDGSSNVYVNYIGLITVELGEDIKVFANDSVFVCLDSGLAGEIVSPLAVNGYVQNTLSGASENIPFALLNPDNTLGNPNEYFLFLLTGNPNNFQATGYLDITILSASQSVTYTQNA